VTVSTPGGSPTVIGTATITLDQVD
jgi:hypothetical protein